MNGPILTIYNHHTEQWGNPPALEEASGELYVGYFENSFGDQWVFTFKSETGRAFLRGGDAGWENVHEVRDRRVPELVLGKGEILWLQACWLATHR
jgi:hypothetical protein